MEGGPNIQEADNLTISSDEENMTNTCYYSCFDPRGKSHRFIALFFMCFLGFGSYFCYDNPAALQDYFTKDLNMTSQHFVMLYSLYSWPNVVLCFVGGFLLDSVFGIGLGTNIYMFLTLLGQVVFAYGTIQNEFWVMALGRFIFGTGGESLAVAQNNYAVLWFKGKELNMVFGLQLSLARIGSTVNFWIMESIYQWVGHTYTGYECLGLALFIAGFSCIISMVCSLFLGCMNKRADRLLRRQQTETNISPLANLLSVKDFPSAFWLVSVIITAYYVTIFPFIALGKQFFIERFNLEPQQANNVNSIIYLISGVASPFLGYLIDKAGRNLTFVVISIITTAIAHSIIIFTYLNPYVGMAIMGIGYSLLASGLWPLVALLVPEHHLGTAYGICQAVQNLGMAVISLLTGFIQHHYGYFWLEMFFLYSLAISFMATICLWIWDRRCDGTLNMSPLRREQREMTSQDKERLLKDVNEEEGESSGDAMQPSSDIQIRNKYLQKIGTPPPMSLNSSYYNNAIHSRLS
nr:major facilitator superfamily domain-containing protein 1-like isoform X2 [Onthophagus taurus]